MTRKIYTMLAACWLCALTSCVDYNDVTSETVVSFQLLQPEGCVMPADLSGHEVILIQGEKKISATTDVNGMATFTNLIPDVYDISCSWELSEADFHQLTGSTQTASGCVISSSLNSQLLKDNQTITLPTQLSIKQDIIIGKIYYAGSKDNNNKPYDAGKYIELYNQSNKDVDVSGYYIGLVEAGSKSEQAYTLENLNEVYQDSVVLLKQIFRIPVNANHKVKAGETVLIVNSAVNHTSNNSTENDLSGADFEAKDVNGKLQNNPVTPALELIYTMYPSISIMNLVQSGPCSVVIFRTDEDLTTLPTTYPYGEKSGNQWKVLPKRMILDAVEVLSNRATGVAVDTKRLYDDLDAGYININAISGRSGEVVYRKTSKKADDGRLILMDTNNSSNDFQVSLTIKPRKYDDEE